MNADCIAIYSDCYPVTTQPGNLYNGARETVADMGTSLRVSFNLLIPRGLPCRSLPLISHLTKDPKIMMLCDQAISRTSGASFDVLE